MPEICRFYGLLFYMNFKDHNPPHFHVWYGDYKIIVYIEDGVVEGKMPKRALKMIFEWLDENREELLNNWNKAKIGEPIDKIEPLK